jgi:hypothetical protein
MSHGCESRKHRVCIEYRHMCRALLHLDTGLYIKFTAGSEVPGGAFLPDSSRSWHRDSGFVSQVGNLPRTERIGHHPMSSVSRFLHHFCFQC